MRARRRIQKDCRGLKGPLEEGEGSKAHLKGGRVRKRTTLGMRNEWWWKNTKNFFFCHLIHMGSLPRLKFLIGEKFSKAISIVALSRWPSI